MGPDTTENASCTVETSVEIYCEIDQTMVGSQDLTLYFVLRTESIKVS